MSLSIIVSHKYASLIFLISKEMKHPKPTDLAYTVFPFTVSSRVTWLMLRFSFKLFIFLQCYVDNVKFQI